jgi:hypothetical protein
MKKKLTVEQEISLFLETWDVKQMMSFLKEIMELAELFDVDETDDWVKDAVGEDNCRNVRLTKAAYIISRISMFHTGKLLSVRTDFPHLWERMEKSVN